jgi:hypothetical protein
MAAAIKDPIQMIMNQTEREILADAYKIIRDMVYCDCGCEPLMHKGNCALIQCVMWMARYEDLLAKPAY